MGRSSPRTPVPQATAADRPASRPATILLVDDEPVARLSTATRLRGLGYTVLEAEDGRQGLKIVRKTRPDLIILDWVMPEMDGPTVCEAIRADQALSSSQIILMTANDRPEQIAEGLARGADDFLSKSASKQEIAARVQAGIRASALVRQLEQTRDDLRAKHEELDAELQSAARFVESLLPPVGSPVPGIHVSWHYQPSLALGGDLFGISQWGPEHLGLFILDASGHGVSAALRAASLVSFLHPSNVMQLGPDDPAYILTETNRRFPMTADGDYFTLWIGTLHLPTRTLSYATAGHAGAILCRPQAPSQWLMHPALPLGFDPAAVFTGNSMALQPRDRLYLMSDGIYEVPAPSGEVWGKQRLQDILERDATRPVRDVLARCMQTALAWQGIEHFPDDAALVGLELTA